MTNLRRTVSLLLIILIAAPVTKTVAQDEVLAELDGIRPHEIAVGGFTLDGEQKISIEAVGFRYRGKRDDARYNPAWILDARSRKVVWELKKADAEKISRHLREYTDEVKLPRGRYEVYYSSFPGNSRNNWDFSGLLGDIVSGAVRGIRDRDFDNDDYSRASRKFRMVVRGDGVSLNRQEIEGYHGDLRGGALVSMTGVEDEHYETISLKLDKRMELDIYAIGELTKDTNSDCSWIVDTRSNEKVWEFDYHDSDGAGGARKNRIVRDTVKLPAGSYAVFCVTDDSHHTGDWNSQPPNDPYFWGLTIQVTDSKMGQHAHTGEYENIDADDVIVELVELGDSDFRSRGFTLRKAMELRVYAIGEGVDRTMLDYGQIVDADTRDVVWEMDYRDTEHAGGAEKNRMVDKVIRLDKGDYIAMSATDGSHSYNDWNASPPYDKKRWGMTITIAEGDHGDVAEYEEPDDETVLVRIIGVGDHERDIERFTLDRDTKIRIYALGEGSRRDMNDYAWIEDARTERVVWEMTYRITDHAGGARKNRVFNDTVSLESGDYIVFYESDGSHSFSGWNASPPKDRWNWGVTIRKE